MNFNDIKIFVGHKKPEFQIWNNFSYIGDIIDLKKNDPYKNMSNTVISEYHSLFLLKNYLEENSLTSGQITICQHRRFVTNTEYGRKTSNQPFANFININEAKNIPVNALLPINNRILLGALYKLEKDILHQYTQSHFIRDILRFASDLIDKKLMSQIDVYKFITAKQFIPAPSCGSYPIELFILIMNTLEKACLIFHESGYIKRDGYQGRVTSFLIERLNSFILLDVLNQINIDFSKCIGYTTIVNENSFVLPGN